jgi:hypothetical protein
LSEGLEEVSYHTRGLHGRSFLLINEACFMLDHILHRSIEWRIQVCGTSSTANLPTSRRVSQKSRLQACWRATTAPDKCSRISGE